MQKFQDVVLDSQGRPVAGAVIAVQSYPGGSPATVYQTDAIGAAYVPITDSFGGFFFYAPNGRYNYTVTVGGVLRKTVTDVGIFDSIAAIPAVQAWTPVVTTSSGSLDIFNASGVYAKVGSYIKAYFSLLILSNGTGAGSVLVNGLPFAPVDCEILGYGVSSSGDMLQVQQVSTSTASVTTYDGTYPGGGGTEIKCYFEYLTD